MATITLTSSHDYYGSAGAGDIIYGLGGDDSIDAAANDTVYGGAGEDELFAGSGPAIFYGGDDDDWLIDNGYSDHLAGDGGDDWIEVSGGADTIDGGDGDDWVEFHGSGAMMIDLRAGTVSGGGCDGTTIANAEIVEGSSYDDTIIGADIDMWLAGGAGADSVVGGTGFDWFMYTGSPTGISINLTTGVFTGGHAQGDVLSGIEGIVGSNYGDTIIGSSGDDHISGHNSSGGTDSLDGGGGYDWLYFDWEYRAVSVNLSTNTVSGLDVNGDTIANFEAVFGSDYADTLIGNAIDNGFDGGDGADVIDGGGGQDWIWNTHSYAGVTIDLTAGTGSGGTANGDAYTSIENVAGSDHADSLSGDGNANELDGYAGNDTLLGGAGNDTLLGGGGADSLDGGSGVDLLDGGSGSDILTGGGGDDVFIVNDGTSISDFADGDRLRVEGLTLTAVGAVAALGGRVQAIAFDGTNTTLKIDHDNNASSPALTVSLTGNYQTAKFFIDNGDLLYDATAPAAPAGLDLATASDTGISSSDNLTTDDTPTISGTAEASSTVTLYDSDGTTALGSTTADGAGAWSITSSTLATGAHTLTAKATDAAGNVSAASTALVITIVGAPAALDLAAVDDSGPSNTDNVTEQTAGLTITGTGDIGATVTVFADANGNGAIDADESLGTAVVAAGAFTVDVALAVGSHRVKAIQTNAAGDSAASAALAITVAAPVPNPAPEPPPPEGRTFTANWHHPEATLNGGGETARVSGFERLTGGSGDDVVVVTDDRGTVTVSGIESLAAAGTANWIALGDGGNRIWISGAETLVGGSGFDTVTLGGGRVILAAIESLAGSAGGDWVDLGNRGNTMSLSGVETLVGAAGTDVVTLGPSGNRLILAAIETVTGGAGGDWVDLGNRGNTMTVGGVETLIGGTGTDAITLGPSGNRLILAAIETVTGGAGGDWVDLGNRGNTMTVSGVETLIGGTGTDVVTLGNGGNTVIVAAVETLYGGAGADAVMLGNRGGTAAIGNVETITGGMRADVVTVLAGATTFAGGGGDDSVVLAVNRARDTVVLSSAQDGTDTIAGFEAGTDRVQLQGELRGLTVTQLGGAIASLTDSGFAAFRAALGPLARPGGSALVLASTGGDSGLYWVGDADGDGRAGDGEVRLLALSRGTVLALADVS